MRCHSITELSISSVLWFITIRHSNCVTGSFTHLQTLLLVFINIITIRSQLSFSFCHGKALWNEGNYLETHPEILCILTVISTKRCRHTYRMQSCTQFIYQNHNVYLEGPLQTCYIPTKLLFVSLVILVWYSFSTKKFTLKRFFF